MKNNFAAVMIACALTASIFAIRQRAQAQNSDPRPTDKTGFTADAAGAKTENKKDSPNLVTEIPAGYRDWPVISVASVGGSVKDLRVKLGNDIAIKAYREGTLSFPDGAIIARIAWHQVTSEENNIAFRRAAERRGLPPEEITKLLAESFVAGAAVNVQFMVKDSKKYASTGGWGFAQFTDGKPDNEAALKACFPCHGPAKDRDFVFTRYAP
jgi:predicted HTH domain antitoxin